MPGFERETTIARPPAAVWELLTDPRRAPAWLDVERVEPVTPGPLRAGSELEATRRTGRKRRSRVRHRVTDFEPERVYAVEVEDAGMTGRYRYELEPADGGTRVVWRADVAGRGLYRLLAGTVARLMEKRDGDRLERLRRVAEADSGG